MSETKCDNCSEPAEYKCASCKKNICSCCNCATDTVDGFFCGTYTQWGCAKNYTTCDSCLDEKAIHEADLNFCEDCGNCLCDKCGVKECEKCSSSFCEECNNYHVCRWPYRLQQTPPPISQ